MTTSEPLGNVKVDTKSNTKCKLSELDLLSYLKRTTKFEVACLGIYLKIDAKEICFSIENKLLAQNLSICHSRLNVGKCMIQSYS